MSVATKALKMVYEVENKLMEYDVPDCILEELTSYLKAEIHAETIKSTFSMTTATVVKSVENFLEKQRKTGVRESFWYMHNIELQGKKYQACTDTHICFCFLDSVPIQEKYIAPKDSAFPNIDKIIPQSYEGMINATLRYSDVKNAIAVSRAIEASNDNKNFILLRYGDILKTVNHSQIEMCFKVLQTKELNVFFKDENSVMIVDDGANKVIIAPTNRVGDAGHMGVVEC